MVVTQNQAAESVRTFCYTFNTGHKQDCQTLKLNVDITEQQNADELTARVCAFHKIPCFVEDGLKKALKEFITKERTKLSDDAAAAMIKKFREKPDSIAKLAKSVAEKYNKSWAVYASNRIQDKDEEFSSMYHKLIHSRAMTLLLALEQNYYREVQKVIGDREQSMLKLRERQELEMQRACEHVGDSFYTESDVNNLAAKHAQDTERLLGHWKELYAKMVGNQRREYRGVVSRLHGEMVANKGEVDEHGHTYIEIKKIIEVSADQVDMYTMSSDMNTFGHYNATPSKMPSRRRDSQSSTDSSQLVSANSSDNLLKQEFTPRMEESFTINLGAQMKTMHNIRLIVAPILHFCQHSDQSGDVQAQRLQTVMSLYSNSLSGVVLLVDNCIDSKSRLKSGFAAVCKSSTEFHFPPLKEQLAEIKCRNAASSIDRLSVKSADTLSTDSSSSDKSVGGGDFKDGDFYVTKHSNLSRVHLVFHLASNIANLQSSESSQTVTSRHPVILGLRHILKVMSSHDTGTLAIPLLLCHELTEKNGEAWILRRAELVMKCMKGFMMEMATWDGGISRTIQFVLPPGIEDSVFERLVCMLPDIFRTTSARVLASPSKKKAGGSQSPKLSKS